MPSSYSMLATRVVTALVLAPLVLLAVFGLATPRFALVMVPVIAIATGEWAALAGLRGGPRWLVALVVAGIGLAAVEFHLPLTSAARPDPVSVAVCAAATMFWVLLAPAWLRHRWRIANGVAGALLGGVLLFAAFVGIVGLHARSPWALLGAMAIVWIADTAAYFAGHAFGRRKLAPQISPGKSWEGVYGGLAAVALYALVLALALPEVAGGGRRGPVVAAGVLMALFMAIAALSVVGDLLESLLKRQAGAKDSGTILPGHGGLLDRIDALLPAMPAAALLADVLGR